MKPIARGYTHQIAFFVACGACLLLIAESQGERALVSNLIYSLSLIGLYGVSTLYHCRHWSRQNYLRMKRIDHAAIFALIAGTATPICLLGLPAALGSRLLLIMWLTAFVGMLMAIFWVQSPKWVRALFYVSFGWIATPYLPAIQAALGISKLWLLLLGGIVYTVGALVYAFKYPNPFPRHFGYHEIFHVFVVIASAFHYSVIYLLTTSMA